MRYRLCYVLLLVHGECGSDMLIVVVLVRPHVADCLGIVMLMHVPCAMRQLAGYFGGVKMIVDE